jgi:cytochrome c553
MATWIVGILLALFVGAIVLKMAKDKRSGKGGCSCSGNCSGCHGCTGNADPKAR